MKKINITTAALFVYLVVMSVIGWPGKQPNPDYTEYFCVIGATILVIFVLRYMQTKRLRIREKMKNEQRK